jgi:hypothetical protein
MSPVINLSLGQKCVEQRFVPTIAIVCGALAFLVFLAVMPPSLTWAHYGADGGDLATAIVRGALPHPPGFPAYLVAGDLFARLPFGEPAWRLSVMSAMFAAGAVALTIATARRAGVNTIAAMTAGLSLAFAPLFWSQAIIVEVYACAAFFAALLLFLAARDAPVWVRGLVLGIATGAHPILVFFFPVLIEAREPTLRISNFASRFIGALVGLLIGWLAMYGGVVRVLPGVPSPWGDVSTLAGWWSFVSGELYRGYVFALPLPDLLPRLAAFAALMTRQYTPLGALLALIGIAPLWRARRDLALASLTTFAFVALFAIGYNTADSFVYLSIALPLAALWLAFGLSRIMHYLIGDTQYATRHTYSVFRVACCVVLLLPLAQLVLFYSEMDLRADRSAVQWAERILRAAPPRAVLLTERDAHTFTLWYAHDALNARPDVIVLDRDLWMYAPYRQMMVREFGLANDSIPEQAAQRMARPIVRVCEEGIH